MSAGITDPKELAPFSCSYTANVPELLMKLNCSLANRINQLIINNEWERLSVETRNRLILKLNLLFRELSRFFSQFELKKILAVTAIFIGFPLAMQSQAFAPPVKNPFFYIPPDSDFAPPTFADIDADQDMDLFLGDYDGNIHFYENNGGFPSELSIIDLNGRMIKSVPIITDDLRLKTDDLKPGIYFVRLVRDNEVVTRKLVVK